MNGLEFAPKEVIISWKGAFGSQRGFSDTVSGLGTCGWLVLGHVPDPEGACKRVLGDIPWMPGLPLAALVCLVVEGLEAGPPDFLANLSFKASRDARLISCGCLYLSCIYLKCVVNSTAFVKYELRSASISSI